MGKNNRIDEARKEREKASILKYGPVDSLNDSRCFLREMEGELLDALNYAEWAREKGEISLKQWKIIDGNIQFIFGVIK